MPNEKMMRVFHVDDGENVNSYTVRDSHINLGYVTCSTAASTTAKEASFSEDIGWRLRAGSNIIVKFTYDVPANATLNVASTGAKAVYHKGTNVTSGVIKAGDVVTFIYDGTNYVITSIDRIMSGVFGEMSANDVIAALGYTPLNAAVKGASNGVAELDNNGKVPASQLPSYVDDVLEYNSLSAFPSTGEDDKIYVAKDTNKIYRWSGSGYVEISSSLALGETSSTAYRGDHGKVAYDHASAKGTAYASGMYKITTNGEGHVTAAIPIVQSDITGLGIKPTQTAVSDPSADGTGVEFIDTILQDTDGVVTVTKKTVRTFGGATSSVDGSTGLVAAPSAGEEDKVLTGAGTWQYMSAASKTFELETVRNVSGSYTHNTSFADVTADMKPISLELSNPEIFLDVINVYCHDGYITLSCDSVVGTSTVKVIVLKQARGQNAEITSAEFDAIAARIGLENAGEDVSLTIPANGWSNSSPYTYTWESDKITTQCRVIVDFSNGTTVIDVPYVTYEKVDGGVQFTAPAQPTTDIPVKIHIIQDYATRVIDIDDETVSSNVVPGTSNVKEALIVLKNNLSNVTPTNAGTQGQILRSDGHGGCEWDNAATQQEIGTAVTTWLNNNIDPTETAVIDNTLSVAHAAAEAKTTGDEITHLKSAFNAAVSRSGMPLDFTAGQVYGKGSGDKIVITTSNSFACYPSGTNNPVKRPDISAIYAKTGYRVRVILSSTYGTTVPIVYFFDWASKIILPDDAADYYIWISVMKSDQSTITKVEADANIFGQTGIDLKLEEEMEIINRNASYVKAIELSNYSSSRLMTPILTTATDKRDASKLWLSDDTNYECILLGNDTKTMASGGVTLVNWGGTYSAVSEAIKNNTKTYFYLFFRNKANTSANISPSELKYEMYNATDLQKAVISIDEKSGNKFAGKKFAVFCDSIGTHGNTGHWHNVNELTVTADDVGHELSAYCTYYDLYTNINHNTGEGTFTGLTIGGITLTDEDIGTEITFTPTSDDIGKSLGNVFDWNGNSLNVWWCSFAEHFGMEPIPVCWASSSYSTHEESTLRLKAAYAWHPSQIRKAGIRTAGSMTRMAPDYVILARGCNDMTHAPYDRLTADFFNELDWDFPADDAATTTYKGLKEAISKTIQGIWSAYPLAKIILCTIPYIKRIDYDNFPTNNDNTNYCQWNDAIRECANFFGCDLFDFAKDGVTHANLSTYSGDNVHPNQAGHNMMAQRAIADFKG